MRSLLFWLRIPPDPEVPVLIWRSFLDTVAGWMVASVFVGVVMIGGAYAWHARARKIRRPSDVFASYTPLRWLFAAVAPAVLVAVVYWLEFRQRFPDARAPEVGDAVGAGLVSGLVTLVLGYVAMCTSVLTPRKYRYRPLAVIFRLMGRRRRG